MSKNYQPKQTKPIQEEKEPVVQKKKPTKKQKTIIIALSVVIALALIAGIVLVSLYATGAFEKAKTEPSIKKVDAGNGFYKLNMDGGTAEGTYAILTFTRNGEDRQVEVILLSDYAPITVANFITYAEEGFYDGTVVDTINQSKTEIRCGGYTHNELYTYTQKKATHNAIAGEFRNNTTGDYSYNTISHFAGVISMDRTVSTSSSATKSQIEANYNSATSLFNLSWDKQPSKDGDYAAFGFIIHADDIEYLKAMGTTTAIDASNRPIEEVIVLKTVDIVQVKDEKVEEEPASGAKLNVVTLASGYKTFSMTRGQYPGTYAIMTINDGLKDYEIEIYLLPEYAPITVANFIAYAQEGFYDGTVIHRIVTSQYTFQGGGYTYNKESSSPYVKKAATHEAIVGEFKNNTTGEYSYNVINHFAGTIAMARTTEPNSATTEFYINWEDYPTWNGDYAAFGFIVDPADIAVIKHLGENTKVSSTKPQKAITITKVEIKEVE